MIGEQKCQQGPGLLGEALIGHRRWYVNDEGWLQGVTYAEPWPPNVMLAHCWRSSSLARPNKPSQYGVQFEDGWGKPYPMETLNPCGQRIGVRNECGHGLYAWHAGRRFHCPQTAHASIAGVMRGFGRVVVGPEGFKCEKARIVALHLPLPGRLWHQVSSRNWLKLRDRIIANYPAVQVFVEADVMYEAHPASDPKPLLEAA